MILFFLFFLFFSCLVSSISFETCSTLPTKTRALECSRKTPNLSRFQAENRKIQYEDKQKFNYASLDCGARILASNPESREIGSILVNAKDKYMVNKCSTRDKFIELEFCQEILVETVVLANFELFSSVFKDLKIYVNHMYPASFKYSWKLIGNFTAQNVKGKQVFNIKNPILWAKYLRIEFITHYGDEYYCPFSQIKVFGTTMMEEVKEFDKLSSSNDDFFDIKQEDDFEIQDSDSEISKDSKVQESFYKTVMKRLAALEESAVFTSGFLKKERGDIKVFLERLEQDQMDVLVDFLDEEWRNFVNENCNSQFQSFVFEIDNYRNLISKKLIVLEETIAQIKQEVRRVI